MINETAFLKATIAYLNGNVPGVTFYPYKQKTGAMSFPCGVVNISSKPAQTAINGETVALVTLHIGVYADEIYAMPNSSGVLTVCDSINEALGKRGFERSNQTEPFYNATYRKWSKDIQFKAKTNVF